MIDFLAQVTTDINTTTTTVDEGVIATVLAMFGGVMLFVLLPIIIIILVSWWKMFEKAGREGWNAIVPIYNAWVEAEIAGKPGWWALVGLGAIIPLIGIIPAIAGFVLSVIIAIELSKAFGKEPVFALLLIFLPMIGYPIIAFGSATYKNSNKTRASQNKPKDL